MKDRERIYVAEADKPMKEAAAKSLEKGPRTGAMRCLIAGGGTGGHLFPGIAVAMELKRRFDADVLFVTGSRRLESDVLLRRGFRAKSIRVEGIKGRGWRKSLPALMKLPLGMLQSAWIIRSFAPKAVLGVGGYSAGPVCLAAVIMGIPTAIHEQNAYPGFTNRALAGRVDRAFISFEASRPHLKARSVVLTGNPVREEFFAMDDKGLRPEGGFGLLVVGGSQGSRAINRVIVDALSIMKGEGLCPRVTHQTGREDYLKVKEDYKEKGLDGDVIPFIEDMAGAYARADLVVSRAGATTIFELAAAGKPSILIPYPHATNRHQEINARYLEQGGAAEMALEKDLSGERLADMLARYMKNPSEIRQMGNRAGRLARPDAAAVIAGKLLEMAGGA